MAWSANSLIAFRILQGIGGGMIMPVGQSIMARTAGPKQMGKVMGVIGIPTMLGPILGPVVGGAIITNMSWRWIFYVNVPIGIVALFLAIKFLKPSEKDKTHRFDLIGFLLLSPGLAILVYGLSEVGNQGGFSSASVQWSLSVGVILIVLFVLRSLRAPEPLIDMRLFKNRTFSVSSICIFLTGMTLYGTMFLLPLYYQIVRGDSPWVAGLMMAPQGIGAAMMMRYSGRLTDRRGARMVVPAGMALLAIGTLGYTQVSSSSNYWFLGVSLFIRGLGLGLGMMPAFASSYRDLSLDAVPRATTTTNILRQVGGSLGVAIFAVVLQTQINHRVPGSTGGLTSIATGMIPPSTLEKVAQAFGTSFWWSFGICAIAIIPGFFLPNSGSKVPVEELETEMVID